MSEYMSRYNIIDTFTINVVVDLKIVCLFREKECFLFVYMDQTIWTHIININTVSHLSHR